MKYFIGTHDSAASNMMISSDKYLQRIFPNTYINWSATQEKVLKNNYI